MLLATHLWKKYGTGLLLFFFFALIGTLVSRDYGIAWDEFEQRQIGYNSYEYVLGRNPDFFKSDNSHGVAFELTLIFVEKTFRITDPASIYFCRHLCTHYLFLLSCLCGFVLIRRLTGSRLLAITGFLMLALMPRIYAHSFFNSKDLPFLSMLLISFLAIQVAFQRMKPGWFAVAAMLLGYTAGIRVMGILPFGVVLLFLVYDLLSVIKDKYAIKELMRLTIVFVVVFCVTLYGIWPFLWRHPFANFADAFTELSYFSGAGGDTLFMGKMFSLMALPKSYIPVWIGITIPVIWLCSGLAGGVALVGVLFKNPSRLIANGPQRNYLLYMGCFVVPPLAVLSLHSIIYDDWRHLYFIYPSFVLGTVYLMDTLRRRKWGRMLPAICILQALVVCMDMVSVHPYQQTYFNRLVSHAPGSLRSHFEMDYWGVSFKQGLDFLVRYDSSREITINNLFIARAIAQNVVWLKGADRLRIRFVEEEEQPRYLMTDFRFHPVNYPYPVIYEQKVQGSVIMAIYKMR